MNRETLFDLRNTIALYPYYQTARLLMLQNLYLLHDPTFGEELRRAAIYITDRKVLFNLFEAAHYQISHPEKSQVDGDATNVNRTSELIDSFLDSIPQEEDETTKEKRRKPTPADAAVDYVAYLLECGDQDNDAPQMKGQSLIDNFLGRDGGRFELHELTDATTQVPTSNTPPAEEEKKPDESIFTETMAKIYIKQGNFLKALEIIKRLNLENPKKSSYFADQIRFIEKLVANSKAIK